MAFVGEGKVTNDKLQIFYIEKVCLLCLSKKKKNQKTIMVFLYLCACRMCTADKKKKKGTFSLPLETKRSLVFVTVTTGRHSREIRDHLENS